MLKETTPDINNLPVLKPTAQVIINTKTGRVWTDPRAEKKLVQIVDGELVPIPNGWGWASANVRRMHAKGGRGNGKRRTA